MRVANRNHSQGALRRRIAVLLTICLLASAAAAAPAPAAASARVENSCPNVKTLQQRITACLSQAKYERALWGIKIASLDTGQTLFEHNADRWFSPASNAKLFTVAMVLDRLGPDYRIKTSVFARSKPDSAGTLTGDLILYGRGDPTITARLHDGDVMKPLESLVRALTNAGVGRVTGDLIADQTFFQGPEFGSGWGLDDLGASFGAEISALSINDNVLVATVTPGTSPGSLCPVRFAPASNYLVLRNDTSTLQPGTAGNISFYRPLGENVLFISGGIAPGATQIVEQVTVHKPAGLFAELFSKALEKHGIRLAGTARLTEYPLRTGAKANPQRMIELGAIESPPIKDITRDIQKLSLNLDTDLLLAHVGEIFRKPQDPHLMTSEQLGIRELKRFLAQTGIEEDHCFFEEGSGLSRNTLVTPSATTALLAYMSRHKHAAIYLDTLPVAGVDGSLQNRMNSAPAAGNLRAKTGTLKWATALSGIVKTAAGERLVFSFMLNRYAPAAGKSASEDLDQMAGWLASLTQKSSGP